MCQLFKNIESLNVFVDYKTMLEVETNELLMIYYNIGIYEIWKYFRSNHVKYLIGINVCKFLDLLINPSNHESVY